MPEVKVFFRKNEDYRIVPVSGVWGGVTPQGMVHCDFFIERAETPESVNIRIDESTGASQESRRQPAEPYVVRELLVGMMLPPHVARSIGQWLVERADEFDRNAAK